MAEVIDSLDEFTDEQGEVRRLGNLRPPEGLLRYAWTPYGAVPSAPLVPRERWAELVADLAGPEDPHLSPAHDQDGIGMCNCSATCGAFEDCRLQAGLVHVPLSGGDLYHRISGGVDRGSLLEDGLRVAMAEGIAPVSVVPYLDWQRNYSAAPEARKKFVVLEAFVCPTFAHCFSAVLQGFRLISGILWYDNYTPDRDGWLPAPRGNSGGHAVRGYKPTRRGNVFGIWHRNSWGGRWGVYNGCCVFPEHSYTGPVGGWWAVRSVVQESGDIPAPKV